MTNIRDKFLVNSMLMVGSTAVRLVLGLITFIVLVRGLEADRLGIYLLIQTIGTSLVMITDLGFNYSASRFIVSADGMAKNDWAKTLLFMKTGVIALAAACVWACKPLIVGIFGSGDLEVFYDFVGLFFICQSVEFFFCHVLQGYNSYVRIALADVSIAVTRLAIVIWILSATHMGLRGVLWAFIVSLLMGCCLLFTPRMLRGRFVPARVEELIRYSWPISVENVLGFLDGKVFSLIVAKLLGPMGLAFFEVANRIPEQLQRVFEAFRSVFFPQMAELFSRNRMKEANEFVIHTVRVIGFISAFLALLAGLYHREIVVFLFSERYAEVSLMFFLLMVVLYCYLICYILWLVLLGGGFSFVSMAVHIAQVTAGIAASFVLIPVIGLYGVAASLLTLHVLPLFIITRILRTKGIHLPASSFIGPFLPFAVSFGIYCALPFGNLFLRGLYALPFLGLSLIFKVVSMEDLRVIRRLIMSKHAEIVIKDAADV